MEEKKARSLHNELFPSSSPHVDWGEWGRTWKIRLGNLEEEKEKRRISLLGEQDKYAEEAARLFFDIHGGWLNQNMKKRTYGEMSGESIRKELEELERKTKYLNSILWGDDFLMEHDQTLIREFKIKNIDERGEEFWKKLKEILKPY